MGPCQRTPKEVARAIRYSGLGVRSVGPVGDFLETTAKSPTLRIYTFSLLNWAALFGWGFSSCFLTKNNHHFLIGYRIRNYPQWDSSPIDK